MSLQMIKFCAKKMNYLILRVFQRQNTPLVMSLKTIKTEDTVVIVVVVSDMQLKTV